MTTVVFVHGTGARGQAAEWAATPDGQAALTTYGSIKTALQERQPHLEVVACAWGETHGYELHEHGSSIPTYAETGGGVLGLDDGTATPNSTSSDASMWGLLYHDPLAELRILVAQNGSAGQGSEAGALLDNRVQLLTLALATPDLRTNVAAAELTETFDTAVQTVRASEPYRTGRATLPDADLDIYRIAVARAIVAEAAMQSVAQGHTPAMLTDATLRDAAVGALTDQLAVGAGGTLGIFSPLENKGLQLMSQLLTTQLRERRGGLTDKVFKFLGDILVYQGEGQAIRSQLLDSIKAATPPVVVLGHSLGGIACVDLLIEHDLGDRVPLLITCGSQAPVFYEMGALESLPYGSTTELPVHFPPWLNVYDLQDMLSFVGNGVFPHRVKDVLVDNRQPFPYAHSAYWKNSAVWDEIMKAIGNPASVVFEA
ncbi:MAG: hypothetical protein H0X37_12560 [Herpetosiphonaceae bacterium]|nr:hypothetical protein [Herpetosiphonaceae bacterium]